MWPERTSLEREVAALAAPPAEREFRLNDLPAGLKSHFARGPAAWQEAVAEAIREGIRNPDTLASLIFFMQHGERIAAGAGPSIKRNEEDLVKLHAEWLLYRAIATGKLSRDGKPQCTLFLPASTSRDYTSYVTPSTTGRITLFINGRSGLNDQVEAFHSMQAAVAAAARGDLIYLAAWQFNPAQVSLTAGPPGQTWADLLLAKARAGVQIRLLLSDFDPLGQQWRSDLKALDDLIAKLDPKQRGHLRYLVSLHPAQGLIIDPATRRPRLAHVATHHQKFLIVRRNGSGTAFCGGLDISSERTPVPSSGWLRAVWHDTHSRLEGLIVRDLEREFVQRWNREKSADPLTLSPHSVLDRSAARNTHRLQMLRTVSLGQAPADIKRDDIWQAYFRLIGCATSFLYFENQYFTEPRMADAVARQSEAQPQLSVIFVIPLMTDDPDNPLRDQIRALQYEFFKRLFAGIPSARRRVYGMVGRYVHAKFVLADDRALSLGSANANQRGFFLDSELNVLLDDRTSVQAFRRRLWAHNLGLSEGAVAGWKPADFLSRWDAVAKANVSLQKTPAKMSGEAVIPFDPLSVKGKMTPGIPDVWAEV